MEEFRRAQALLFSGYRDWVEELPLRAPKRSTWWRLRCAVQARGVLQPGDNEQYKKARYHRAFQSMRTEGA